MRRLADAINRLTDVLSQKQFTVAMYASNGVFVGAFHNREEAEHVRHHAQQLYGNCTIRDLV